jgi:hypothetical protein
VIDGDTIRATFPGGTFDPENLANDCVLYSDGVSDVDPGDVIDLGSTPAAQPDGNTVTVGEAAAPPALVGTANAMASIRAATPDTIDLSFDRAVEPYDDNGSAAYAATQFSYQEACDGTSTAVATGVTQVDADTLRLSFAPGTLPLVDKADDCIRYTDTTGGHDDGDVVETAAAAPLASGAEVAFGVASITRPNFSSTANPVAGLLLLDDTIDVIYDGTVIGDGGAYATAQFAYRSHCTDGPSVAATDVSQPSSDVLTLSFPAGTLPTTDNPDDCIVYVDDLPEDDAYPESGSDNVDLGDALSSWGWPQATNTAVGVGAAS